MKATEMKAKDRGREVRIFVSGLMRNDSGNWDSGRPIYGYWYAVKGGEAGYFVTRRPTSGCSLQGLGQYECDIFNVNGRIETKEEFIKLITM